MSPSAIVTIAEYLRVIHDDMIWPLLAGSHGGAGKPDKLAAVQGFLMSTYARAAELVGGDCVRDEDCEQQEVCIRPSCVPWPQFEFEFAPVAEHLPDLGADVGRAIEAYFGKIHDVLCRSLAADSRKLKDVRDVLMCAYAEAHKVACLPLEPCPGSCACGVNKECIDGVCVPIPFRLRVRVAGAPLAPPWRS